MSPTEAGRAEVASPPAHESEPGTPVSGLRLYSLRTSLYALVLVCVLPLLGLAGYLVWHNYQLERARVYGQSIMLAREVSAELDRELSAIESGLRVLATSEYLARGDLERFYQQAREAVPTQIVYNYVMTDPAGRQVVNTVVPWGTPLPSAGTPPQLAAVFTERRTVLTDLFQGPVVKRPVLAMGVPVRIGGEIRYSLNVGLDPAALDVIMRRFPMRDDWLLVILDRQATILARSRAADDFVGQKAVPEVVERILSEPEASFMTVTKEGIPAVSSHHRSATWGWTVAVGVHRSVLERELRQALTMLVLGVGAVFAVGLWLVRRITRRVLGTVQGLDRAARAVSEGQPVELPEVGFIEAEGVSQALQRAAQAMSEVQSAAYHDALTGLANRRLLMELATRQLASARRQQEPVALLALDLDNFKAVNDTHGHAAGDALLREVSVRLKASVRDSDVVARVGGDEFVVLMSPVRDRQAYELAQRLIATISAPYPGVQPRVSASVGVALYPRDGESLDALLRAADRALYAAKDSGKGRWRDAASPPTSDGPNQ